MKLHYLSSYKNRLSISIEKLLIVGIQGGVFLIFILPLWVIPEAAIFPVRIFNSFLFRIVVETIALLYLILVLYNRAYLPRFSFLSLGVFLFIGALGISTLLGLSPYRSFWGDMLRMQGYVFFLHILIFHVVLIGIFRTRQQWISLFRLMLAAGGILAAGVVMISLTMPDAQRITPLAENSSFYGSYLVIIIFLNLFWILQERQKEFRVVWFFTLFLNLIVLILNETRGAWLAVFVGFLTLALLWLFVLSKNQLRKRMVVGVSIIGLLAFFFLGLAVVRTYFPDNSSVQRYYSLWHKPSENIQERFLIWKTVFSAVKRSPFFGYGPESFQYVYEKNYQHAISVQYPTSPISFYHAHNQFIDILVISGFVGLFSYISMFGIAIFLLARRSYQTINPFARMCLISLLVAHVIEGMFLFTTLNALLLLYAVLSFISVASSYPTQNLHVVRNWSPIKSLITLAAIIGIAISLYTFHWQPIKAQFYLRQASIYLGRAEIEKGISVLERSINTPSFMTFDMTHFGLYYLYSAEPSAQDSVIRKEYTQKLDIFAQLLQEKLEANPTYPFIYSQQYLAKAYMSLYHVEKDPVYLMRAQEVMEKAMQMNPQYAPYFSFVKEK